MYVRSLPTPPPFGTRIYCVDSSCNTPRPAAVPELEDYAAAAFLVLALTIGWQVRQRRRMA